MKTYPIVRDQWLLTVVKPQLGEIDKAVEVGVWRGDYSRIIIESLKPKHFYGVDPYLLHEDYGDCPDDTEFANQQNLDNLYEQVNQTFSGLPAAKLLRSKGTDAALCFQDQELDFVYIDGDHSYDFVSKDIKAWWPKIKPGGILSGHDYTTGNPQKGHIYGVIQAVDEFVKENHLNLCITHESYATWWVVKSS
jgi:hypothetical protein